MPCSCASARPSGQCSVSGVAAELATDVTTDAERLAGGQDALALSSKRESVLRALSVASAGVAVAGVPHSKPRSLTRWPWACGALTPKCRLDWLATWVVGYGAELCVAGPPPARSVASPAAATEPTEGAIAKARGMASASSAGSAKAAVLQMPVTAGTPAITPTNGFRTTKFVSNVRSNFKTSNPLTASTQPVDLLATVVLGLG